MPTNTSTSARTGGARPAAIPLVFREPAALHAAYIPLFADGGIFVPTDRHYQLGDDVDVLVTLPEDTQGHAVAGKVAWITPARAPGHRAQGVGVRFPRDQKSVHLKRRIEAILGAMPRSDRPTQTI